MHVPTILRAPMIFLAAAALGAGACAAASVAAPGAGGDPTHPVSVDWNGPTIDPIDLGDDWTVTPCVEGATVLCVTDGTGRSLGTVELGAWRADEVGPIAPWLREQVREFVATFADDRHQTCGDDYTFGLDGAVADVVVDGSPGVTFRYRGTDSDGVERERGVTTLVVRGHEVFWISSVAYDPGGCVAAEQGEFTPTVLGAFEPWYRRIIEGSTLPLTVVDGRGTDLVHGRLAFNGASIAIDHVQVLSGERARAAAVEDGVLEEGQDLPNDVYVRPGRTLSNHDVAEQVTVSIYDCTSGCQLVEVSLEALRDGTVVPYGGTEAVFEVTMVAGLITALTEVYLP